MTIRKTGKASATPGVSAQPGCMQYTEMCCAAQRSARIGVKDYLHPFRARIGDGAAVSAIAVFGVGGGQRLVYIPPEDMKITRGSGELASTGSRSSVNSTGPKTWVARVISCPSPVSVRVAGTHAIGTATSERSVAHNGSIAITARLR